MGSVYRCAEPRKQKGRFIYNRERLHKVGYEPKHKPKTRAIMNFMDREIKDYIHSSTCQTVRVYCIAFNHKEYKLT